MAQKEHILIVGAGLCGSLLALRLAQRGYKISLVEKRPDLRKTDISAGRSINLALSDRGIRGLRLAGLEEKIQKLCIPMHGRMIHDKNENTFLSPYSGLEEEYINSISRGDLNALLLDEAEGLSNVNIRFNQECIALDLDKPEAFFRDFTTKEEQKLTADVIIGTDGAGSVVRQSMMQDKDFLFSFSQDYLQHGYKELSFKPAKNGGYQVEKNALHIWPRGENMLIALPNLDGSFTVTLFLSYEKGLHNFKNLSSKEEIEAYFKEQFPDAYKLMPHLAEEFAENPVGPLGTVKCSPWTKNGKTLLMGDAAHAIVPFYGQGMNASFEDVAVLDQILDKNYSTWEQIFKAYEKARKKDTDAIADLAIDNFDEMKAHTAAPIFQEKRKLETAFEQNYPEQYASKYRLVTFREDIGYAEALKIGRAQDKAILKLLSAKNLNNKLSLQEKLNLVKTKTKNLLQDTGVVKQL